MKAPRFRPHIGLSPAPYKGLEPRTRELSAETEVENEQAEQVQAPSSAVSDEQLVEMLVDRARNEGLQLTGEGGLLQQLTKRVLESALEGEITDHVGYDKHDPRVGIADGGGELGVGLSEDRRRAGRSGVQDCAVDGVGDLEGRWDRSGAAQVGAGVGRVPACPGRGNLCL
jgi:hypothetical protein